MDRLPGTVWIALIVLILLLLIDILYPKSINEGFKVLVGSNVKAVDNSGNYFSRYFPKRGDVGPFKEEKNYIMDPRYFHDYVDVQGLGFKHDYCRLVIPENVIQNSLGREQVSEDAKKRKLYGEYANAFLACALAGTGNTPTATFKSKTVANGLPHHRRRQRCSKRAPRQTRPAAARRARPRRRPPPPRRCRRCRCRRRRRRCCT